MAFRRRFNHRFPWKEGNSIKIHIDSGQYFGALFNAFKEAKQSIHIELYWISSGHVLDQLIHILVPIIERGIQVSCLLDQLGSRNLSQKDINQLINSGVHFAWYNPVSFSKLHLLLKRNHSKLFIIDASIAFTGGTGIADEFLIKSSSVNTNKDNWRDNLFSIQGPVVLDCLRSLEKRWNASSTVCLTDKPMFNLHLNTLVEPQSYNPLFYDQPSFPALWISSESHHCKKALKLITRSIRKAKHEVIIVTAYFAPPKMLYKAILKAAAQGVDVTLLLPCQVSDHPLIQLAGQYYYENLLQAGVKIFEYQHRFLHMKLIICDEISCIGSSNFDIYTHGWSLESNLIIRSKAFTDSLKNMLKNDFKNTKQIIMNEVLQRGIFEKAKIKMIYKIGQILNWLSQQFRLYLFARKNKNKA